MKTLILVFLMLATTEHILAAQVSDYERLRPAQWFQGYIAGVGQGLQWANYQLKREGSPLVYCVPYGVTEPNPLALLDTAIKQADVASLADKRVEQLLLQILLARFPCTSAALKYPYGKPIPVEKAELQHEIDAILNPPFAQVNVESSVPNVDVFVDGRFAGNAPLPSLRLTIGAHTIEVKAPSFAPWKRELVVAEGTATRVFAQLERAP
jgi:hypothetical protein